MGVEDFRLDAELALKLRDRRDELAGPHAENRVLEEYESEVPVQHIGELVMRELKKLDQIAYVRFASVYRDFQDITQFMDELKPMIRDRGSAEQRAKKRGSTSRGGSKQR